VDIKSKVLWLTKILATYFTKLPPCSRLNIQINLHTRNSVGCDDNSEIYNKGKSVPLQAQGAQEGSRKLRFPDYVTMVHDDGKIISLMHGHFLPPGNTPGTHFC